MVILLLVNMSKEFNEIKEYNKDQCVYRNKNMKCFLCSAMCKERYEDFKKRGINIQFL